MDTLRRRLSSAFAVLALLESVPAHADPLEAWRRYIAEASARFAIPARWIERVMQAESGGRTVLDGRPITSRAGAIGLMQLMPGTWSAMRNQQRLGADPRLPRDNILAGAAYLSAMYDRFGFPGCFAAYNAGPARYEAFLAGKKPLPSETRNYLDEVLRDSWKSSSTEGVVEQSAIFIALSSRSSTGTGEGVVSGSLFVSINSPLDIQEK